MNEELENGYEEDLGNGKVRRWRAYPNGGGCWVTDRKGVDRTLGLPVSCPVCKQRWIKMNPEAANAFRKWECCDLCVIEHVDGNEERWAEGWRPNEKEVEFWRSKRSGRSKFAIG